MRLTYPDFRALDEAECARVVDYMLDVLAEVGMKIDHEKMCEHLAENGADWDGRFGVRFPRGLMEEYIARERNSGAEASSPCTGGGARKDITFFGAVGGYPLRWLDPHDSTVKMHTAHSIADVVRLADYLPWIDAVGSPGVPSDVPPLLRPFYMRLVTWRYTPKLANSYVIWDPQLCRHIAEFCECVSEMESHNGGMERWFRANNYLVSPLHYPRQGAEEFMWFWEHGYRCTIGNLSSIGGTTPVTLAGSVGMALAETLAINWMMHVFYGDKGLYIGTQIAPLDMRTGFMPYGRPEQLLATLAQRDVCRHLGTEDEFRMTTHSCAKDSDVEQGLATGFSTALQMTLLGGVSADFALVSTDEVLDPRLMVIGHDFFAGMHRFVDGIEVSDETLSLDVVKEVGPGGVFLSHPHTAEHFKDELWTPRFLSGESLESWKASGSQPILEKARLEVVEVLKSHHPRGIKGETEEALLALIEKFARELDIADYRVPSMPE